MRILVLGGTAFVGRHFVEAALARGHEPVLFTRGQTSPGLFPQVEHVQGDREQDLGRLAGRSFDAVVDTSGYLPRLVAASARALAGAAHQYVFVSTISVYEEAGRVSEDSPTRRPADPASEDVGSEYGGLKTLCEEAVRREFPGSVLVLRPGLIVGPHDYTGRFSYWPRRLARGGEVLAPGRPEARVWFVDVRDLAAFTLALVERGEAGTYNVDGPAEPLTMRGLFETCRDVAGSDARLTWVPGEFLTEQGVAPYTELPLWLPDPGHPEVEIGRAVAAGLALRPVRDTIAAVLADDGAASAPVYGWERPPAGLDPARERELLAAWYAAR